MWGHPVAQRPLWDRRESRWVLCEEGEGFDVELEVFWHRVRPALDVLLGGQGVVGAVYLCEIKVL